MANFQPKQYGLVLNKKAKKTRNKKPNKLKSSGLFSASASPSEENKNSSEDQRNKDAVRETLRLQATAERQKAAIQKQHEDALKQGGESIFAYDEVYDKVSTKANQKPKLFGVSQPKKESKYIQGLIATSKLRQHQYDRAQEKIYKKEADEVANELGDAEEVFVTNAYKKKKEERKLWEVEEARQAELEARNDVRKKKDLSGFYRGILGDLTDERRTVPEFSLRVETVDDLVGSKSESKLSVTPKPGVFQALKPGISREDQLSVVSDEKSFVPRQRPAKKARVGFVKSITPATLQARKDAEFTTQVAPERSTPADKIAAARARALARKKQRE